MVTRRRLIATGLAAGAVLAGGSVFSGFRHTLNRRRARIAAQNSSLVQTRFGNLEYAERGGGPPFLMVHGTGGGFDQGLLFAERMVTAGYRVIAPSRFGYLRSTMPEDPSSQNQADAFVDLLDTLGIDRVAIAGGSAGALSALQFAIRHPDRCAALFPVVPATYAPDRPPARPWGTAQTVIAKSVLQSDFLFWTGIVAARKTMIETLLATDYALVTAASPAEKARVDEILYGILPVSDRAQGLLNDALHAGTPEPMPLQRITAPTLAISLQDDRFLTADAARHIAAEVPGARLIVYPTGGHIWIGHDADLFGAIDRYLRDLGYR